MYGLIHKAARSAVINISDKNSWDDILSDAGQSEVVLSADYYDDEVTMRLVDAVATKFGKSRDEVLKIVGEHWVEFTVSEGYNSIFTHAGDTLEKFLINLDRMHNSLTVTLPNAVMPSFQLIKSTNEGFELIYRSQRTGFATFVEGILMGLCEYYNTPMHIIFEDDKDGIRFSLKHRQSLTSISENSTDGKYKLSGDFVLKGSILNPPMTMSKTA